MSKLYSLYKDLKLNNNETIYLFKSGIFYIALADDAITLSHKFGFKLTNLNATVMKCGFPLSSTEKYIKLFENNNINFKLIDTNSNTIYTPKNYIVSNNINELIDSIISIDTDLLSVSECYKFIESLKMKSIEIKKYYRSEHL